MIETSTRSGMIVYHLGFSFRCFFELLWTMRKSRRGDLIEGFAIQEMILNLFIIKKGNKINIEIYCGNKLKAKL